jgi:hypothetical protein
MPIAQSLATFQAEVAQCDSLIISAHQTDAVGNVLFSQRDREQITVAAFLNLFIAWEGFVEAAMTDFMMGDATTNGNQPVRLVTPTTREHAVKMVIHIGRYFDYANHDNVRKIANLYFDTGYPFEVPIKSIIAELSELKTMRNACAHISSSTQTALEALATRIMGQPQPNITIYQLLTMLKPHGQGNITIFASYRDVLLIAANLIAVG